MQKKTRSILAELDSFQLNRDREHFVESRANNVIQSAINLLQYIKEHYDHDTSSELERRFINSIRSGDSSKFARGIKKIRPDT